MRFIMFLSVVWLGIRLDKRKTLFHMALFSVVCKMVPTVYGMQLKWSIVSIETHLKKLKTTSRINQHFCMVNKHKKTVIQSCVLNGIHWKIITLLSVQLTCWFWILVKTFQVLKLRNQEIKILMKVHTLHQFHGTRKLLIF